MKRPKRFKRRMPFEMMMWCGLDEIGYPFVRLTQASLGLTTPKNLVEIFPVMVTEIVKPKRRKK